MDWYSGIYGLFGKWVISGQLKIKEGEISLLHQRVSMIPTSFLINLQKNIPKTKDSHYRDDLYLNAWRMSFEYIKLFVETYELENFESRYKWGMDIACTAGLGDYKTIDYKYKEFSHFHIFDNPIAQAFYPSKKPVDVILRGINAGGGVACHLELVNCLEVDCEAMNGKQCEFITGTEKAHQKLGVDHLYNEQMDLDYILPIQKELIKEIGFPKGVK